MTTKRLHYAVTKSHGLMPVSRHHFAPPPLFIIQVNSKPNSRIESIRIEVIFGELECTKLYRHSTRMCRGRGPTTKQRC